MYMCQYGWVNNPGTLSEVQNRFTLRKKPIRNIFFSINRIAKVQMLVLDPRDGAYFAVYGVNALGK